MWSSSYMLNEYNVRVINNTDISWMILAALPKRIFLLFRFIWIEDMSQKDEEYKSIFDFYFWVPNSLVSSKNFGKSFGMTREGEFG